MSSKSKNENLGAISSSSHQPECHQPKLPCRFKTFLPQTSTETSMAPAFFFATTKIQENIHYKGALHIAKLT